MDITKSARDRIMSAFFELLKDKPYTKITVSAVIALAQVNRSTFYRNFENVEDLMECATDEVTKVIAVEPPFPVTDRASLERYGQLIMDLAAEYHQWAALLCSENGKSANGYRIANAVRDQLEAVKQAAGISDPEVDNCINLASPTLSFFFKAGFVFLAGDLSAPQAEIRFDPACSMLQNVGRLLSRRRGGSDYFHYDLLCAYVLLDSKDRQAYRDISVSELLATAGIARTEFYKYYKNIEDFFEAFEDACVYCALYWLTSIWDAHFEITEAQLAVFVNKEKVKMSIAKFFIHGRISDYFPKILSLVLRYLNAHIPGGLHEEEIMIFSFYTTEFAYAICSYLTGLTDYPTLKQTLDHLDGVRARHGI